MSNGYPPGVTGNEEFFGPDAEEPMDVVCGASATLVVYTKELDEELGRVFQMAAVPTVDDTLLRRLMLAISAVRNTVADLPSIDTLCPFEGEIDVAVYGRGPSARAEWTCPVCETEHTDYPGEEAQ